ncbi:MAG: hypothetical protein ACRCR9_07005 [Chitinophagaceae bacterium]
MPVSQTGIPQQETTPKKAKIEENTPTEVVPITDFTYCFLLVLVRTNTKKLH